MKRLVLIIGLMIVLLLVLHEPVTYAKTRTGHDSDMELVFFGDVKAGSGQKKVAKILEAAAYLTIDQFGGNGQNSSRRRKVGSIRSIRTIDRREFKIEECKIEC